VNVSSLKLGVYDLLGLVVPGMFVICEGWIAVRGWPRFVEALSALCPVSFTVFLAGSFVIGHFVQEIADWGVKRIKGPRFFKKGRDEAWGGVDGDAVKTAIWAESGLTIASVDSAFDYCLTRIGEAFSKRDVFIATSDFARSFLVLAMCGIAPAWRLASDRTHSISALVLLLVAYVVVLTVIGQLAWRRMVRFRYISDCGVFAAYLASRTTKGTPTAEVGGKA
jgi:hypothetical protein